MWPDCRGTAVLGGAIAFRYAAPEVLLHGRAVKLGVAAVKAAPAVANFAEFWKRADVFSFGILLYQLCSGLCRPPIGEGAVWCCWNHHVAVALSVALIEGSTSVHVGISVACVPLAHVDLSRVL